MLIKAQESNLWEISRFCHGSTLGTRILCYAECYGFERDFVEFYICRDSGKTLGVLMRFDDNMTVVTKNYSPTDEMTAFIEMLCCSTLVCDKAVNFHKYSFTGEKTAYIYRLGKPDYTCEDVPEEKYKEMYTLISESIPDSFSDDDEAYLSFLSDFTFRKTRSRSRANGIVDDEENLVACALTSAETKKFAVISGVACHKNKRKDGLGKRVVLSVADELLSENKTPLVIALNDSAKGFYEHIGFEEFEKIYYFGRKN